MDSGQHEHDTDECHEKGEDKYLDDNAITYKQITKYVGDKS